MTVEGRIHYPVIGLPAWEKGFFGRCRLYPYMRCLEREGAVVRLLEPENGREAALRAAEEVWAGDPAGLQENGSGARRV